MSFLSILKVAGKDILIGLKFAAQFSVQASPVAGEIVGIFDPPAGHLISMIGTKVLMAESQFTEAKSGAQKKAFVLAELTDALQLCFALQNKPIPTDLMIQTSSAVDSFVSLMNSIHGAVQAGK